MCDLEPFPKSVNIHKYTQTWTRTNNLSKFPVLWYLQALLMTLEYVVFPPILEHIQTIQTQHKNPYHLQALDKTIKGIFILIIYIISILR